MPLNIQFKLAGQYLSTSVRPTRPLPNRPVKRTPTRPMASPFLWALLVPCTRFAPSGAAYLLR